MKSKTAKRRMGWLDRKLANPAFRKGFEEELQKLALEEQLTRLRKERMG